MTDKEGDFDTSARKRWINIETKGIGSVLERMQQKITLVIDESLAGTRIEYVYEFDNDIDDKGDTKVLEWCGGIVERICDGTWIIPGARTKCYKEGEAAEIFWDAIICAGIPQPQSRTIERLDPRKWNKHVVGAWRRDFGDISYGM